MSITSVRSRPAFTSLDAFCWPGDFARVPDEEWTRQPVDQFGLSYDDVGSHGWYKNLEPTIAQVLATLERVAFLLFRWLKAEKRLQSLDEVAGSSLLYRGADAITSTNAIHLYYDLYETLASWARVLRPGGLADDAGPERSRDQLRNTVGGHLTSAVTGCLNHN